jgi:hypothetical protein
MKVFASCWYMRTLMMKPSTMAQQWLFMLIVALT